MRRRVTAALLCLAWLVPAATADAIDAPTLAARLTRMSRPLGSASGAYVRDLDTGRVLYQRRANRALVPASTDKLLVTSATLLALGPDATLHTSARTAVVGPGGVVDGDLYLVGAGDPFLTTAQLVGAAQQVAAQGVTHVRGSVLGDGSLLDARVGSYHSAFGYDGDLGGRLGGLVVDHGAGREPAVYAAQRLAKALRAVGVRVDGRTGDGAATGVTVELAGIDSPPVSRLLALTNQPSNNFAAEMLLKVLGARLGGSGTTTAGTDVVRRTLAGMGLHTLIRDGSGLSRADRLAPRDVVRLLERMSARADGPIWRASLAIAGRVGTLSSRMRRTRAQDACAGKTGTLTGVSALSGYCTAANGHTIAFSFIENRVYAPAAKRIEDRLLQAIVRYDG